MAKNAAEYRTIKKHLDEIALSINNDLTNLRLKLIREDLITPNQGTAMRNTSVSTDDRAADFVGDILLNFIEQDSVNFFKFVNVLIASGATYKIIVKKLLDTHHTLQEPDLCYHDQKIEEQIYHEYVYVKQKGRVAEAELDIIDKHWKETWVEMSLAPKLEHNHLTFHKSKEEWKNNHELGVEIPLKFENELVIERADPTYYPGKHVLLLKFPDSSQIDIAFDSMIKMDQWHEALTRYLYVDLVRCHNFPDIEGEYIVEVCRPSNSYKMWPVDPDRANLLGWEWKFSDIESFGWHKLATKLKVNYKLRSSKMAGVGQFFFIGCQASRLFTIMNEMSPRQLNDYSDS